MKISIFFNLFSLLAITGLLFTSCSDDDVTPPLPQELITTVNYTLVPTGGGETVTLSFTDLDGDGGNDPVVTSGILVANQASNGSLELLDESGDETEDITEEVMEEDLEHQFFFRSTIEGLSITYNDTDPDGNPVGLSSILTTGSAATGTISVQLLHEPDKTAEGVSEGDNTNAGGETDIDVTFSVDVQ